MYNTLVQKKIKVKPVVREGGFHAKGNDGHFMFTGTAAKLCVPVRPNGVLVDPLEGMSPEAIVELATMLAMKPEDFNVNKKEKNFWKHEYDGLQGTSYKKGEEVSVDKNEKTLDLSNPIDFLEYRVLLANTEFVAPTLAEQKEKGSYRFVLVDEDEEVITRVKSSDKRKEATKAQLRLEESETRLKNFLRVYGRTVPATAKKDWLVAEVDKVVEENMDGFLTIVKDPDYENRLFILDAVNAKAIVKTGTDEYSLQGGKKMGKTGSMKDAIAFIKDPKNQPEVLTIKARLDAKE